MATAMATSRTSTFSRQTWFGYGLIHFSAVFCSSSVFARIFSVFSPALTAVFNSPTFVWTAVTASGLSRRAGR